MEPALRNKRPDVEADSLLDAFEIGNLARLGNLKDLRLKARPGPADLFQRSLHDAADIESPNRLPGRKAQAFERMENSALQPSSERFVFTIQIASQSSFVSPLAKTRPSTRAPFGLVEK